MRKLIMSAALLCSVLAAGPARAQAPNDSLPYVTSIRTIPAQPCDSIPTMLVIEGVFPTQCGAELTHDDDNFTLYISEASTSSLRALRNLQVLLEGYEPSQVDLHVVDLSKERPPSFDEDRITFTPTLVRRTPEPRVYLLGTLENLQTVTDLLSDAKVERRK